MVMLGWKEHERWCWKYCGVILALTSGVLLSKCLKKTYDALGILQADLDKKMRLLSIREERRGGGSR